MKRVYVAGSYSSNNVIQILDNIREGVRLSTEVLLAGYAPFSPWLDYHFQLMLRPGEKLTIDDYYKYSLAWLIKADAILIVPNSDNSVGTQNEIEIAHEYNIPVFHSLEKLNEYFHRT